MIRTKNQIRPRREKFRFSNAEILLFDTAGTVQIVPPAPLGQGLLVLDMQMRANVVVAYGNDDPAAFCAITDDFCTFYPLENDMGTTSAVSDLLVNNTGLNLWNAVGSFAVLDSFNETTYEDVTSWVDAADLAAFGGIYFHFANGGSDLTDGDPANYLDIFIDYKIIDL